MKYFNKDNKKTNLSNKQLLINSYSYYQKHRSIIKKLITISLISLFIFHILSLSACTGACNVDLNEDDSSSIMTFKKGWYIYDDHINKPLYILYENEDKITRLGTFNEEVSEEKKEIYEKSFSFYRVINSLKYLKDADVLVDIPSWAVDFSYKDYEIYDNKIEGFSCPFTVSDIQDINSFNKPTFLFFQKGDKLTYETFYYKLDNDFYSRIETKKPLSLFVVCEDPLFSSFFKVSNSLSGNVVDNNLNVLSNLTNNLTFTSLKEGSGEGDKTFPIEIHNKERGEDSYMFTLYLKL